MERRNPLYYSGTPLGTTVLRTVGVSGWLKHVYSINFREYHIRTRHFLASAL